MSLCLCRNRKTRRSKTRIHFVMDEVRKQGNKSCLRCLAIVTHLFSDSSKLKSSLKEGWGIFLIYLGDEHNIIRSPIFIQIINVAMQRVNISEREEGEEHICIEEDDLELMTANLIKIKREITDRNEQPDHHQPIIEIHDSEETDRITTVDAQKYYSETLVEEMREKYNEFLTQNNLPNNHEEKLQILLEQEALSVGSAIALFEMLFYFREALNEEVLCEISEKAYEGLNREQLSQIEEYCFLELLAICGVYDEKVLNYVVENMLENKINFTASFLVLSNMGFNGLAALVHLARQDFQKLPNLILDHLSRTEEIVKQLIVPTLVEDLLSSKSKGREKEIILSILNRLNHLVAGSSEVKLFPVLIELMQNNHADRGFIASVLRSAGPQGEKILIEFMNQTPKNEKTMLPIVSVLPWRVHPDPVLRIKVIEYTLGSNFLPGTLYQYEGNIAPSAFCFDEESCCDSLCLNARDFIAALQRLLSSKMDNYENEETMRRGEANNIKLFILSEVIGKRDENEEIQISADVIKALSKALTNSKPEIREAAINSFGLIGLPQAYDIIDDIAKCLWDVDSRNRSMACWALSKICEEPSRKITNRLIELLKDSFWKVRISACICIGAIVQHPSENVIEALLRCLKDNSVNKLTVCQTIIKLGAVGEEILLEILRTASNNDFKLKEAVIYSLKEADIKVSSIDFVLEQIFKHCKGTRVETRAACLETLNSLRTKANEEGEQIVYLRAKSILPFYYYFLEDPAPKIRQMAANAIFSFGGQAELIFIEGMTKGNPTVRVQSAKGLAKLGIQNFRALILGLRDEDVQVRKVTSEAIIESFSAEDVSRFYSKKPQQIASLLCNLKDILVSGGLAPAIRTFLKETIYHLERQSQNINFNDSAFQFSQKDSLIYSKK